MDWVSGDTVDDIVLTPEQRVKFLGSVNALSKTIRDDLSHVQTARQKAGDKKAPTESPATRRARLALEFSRLLGAASADDYDMSKVDFEADMKAPPQKSSPQGNIPANDNSEKGHDNE